MTSKPAWDLKNRAAIQSIQPQQQQFILRSQEWLRVVGKPLLWVLERGIELERVGCLFGKGDVVLPDFFVCLVARLLQILPKPEIVLAMVKQDVHKYLRMLGTVVIRLIGNQAMENIAMATCFADFRNIRVREADGTLRIEPMDQLCETLFFGCDDEVGRTPGDSDATAATSGWLGLHLSASIHRPAVR